MVWPIEKRYRETKIKYNSLLVGLNAVQKIDGKTRVSVIKTKIRTSV